MRKREYWMPKVKNLGKVKSCGAEAEWGYINLLGETFVVVISEDEYDPIKMCHMEHVSISHRNLNHLPSWHQMCALKDIFFEDEEECFQVHPKKSQYVNVQPNCLHMWRVKE